MKNTEHRIDTVLDILKLDEDEFRRFLPDLAVWYAIGRCVNSSGGVTKGFIWVDDGKPGEVSQFLLEQKDGTFKRFEV